MHDNVLIYLYFALLFRVHTVGVAGSIPAAPTTLFVVTKGQATAEGVPRIDIRPWDSGNLPDPSILQSVVAATLKAIEDEAGKREWGLRKSTYIPSPIIPLLASRPDMYKALFDASAERILIPNADASDTFGTPTPPIHIHIIGKPHMINAFKAIHALPRFFGGKPMVPGLNILNNCHKLNS